MICNGLIFEDGHGIIQMNFIVNMEFTVYNKKVGGEISMCKMLEDMRNEAELNKAKKMAVRMIKAGKMSLEDIADYTELPLDTVRELESQAMQMA